MKRIFTLSFLFLAIAFHTNAQKISWNQEVKLAITNYKSASTEINDTLKMYSIGSGAYIDFSFAMTTYEFALTKNFNSKVKAVFDQSAAYIVAPSQKMADELLQFGQYQFDLNELYARKLRKSLYERKGILSGVEFFKPVYDSLLMEMNKEFSAVSKESTLGTKKEILQAAHQKVTAEITELFDFCFECTPPKKKKGKK
jgi:hypothetical protein